MELTLAVAALAVVAAAGVLRHRWLTPAGAGAAVAVGLAILIGTGTAGLALLLLFFVSASILTRLRPTGERVDRDRRGRSARQVLANGGVAATASLLALLPGVSGAVPAVVGALAAATADTWASEVGMARRGVTRLITTGARVEPGHSGGVSAAGSAAGLCGALLVGVAGAAFGIGGSTAGVVVPAVGAGLAGMLLDSVLGAAIEGRYRVVDNDVVNAAGTLAGAIAGWALG